MEALKDRFSCLEIYVYVAYVAYTEDATAKTSHSGGGRLAMLGAYFAYITFSIQHAICNIRRKLFRINIYRTSWYSTRCNSWGWRQRWWQLWYQYNMGVCRSVAYIYGSQAQRVASTACNLSFSISMLINFIVYVNRGKMFPFGFWCEKFPFMVPLFSLSQGFARPAP